MSEDEGRAGPVLVAVGGSPSSADLVRWAVRQARSAGAECRAVHVDTGVPRSSAERRRLDENLCLARTLGASVEIVPGRDLPTALVAEARECGASMVVVGRSGPTRLPTPWGGGTVSERIAKEAGPFAVAVIREGATPAAPAVSAPSRGRTARRLVYGAGIALAAAALTGVLAALAPPFVSSRSLAFLYLAAIVALSLAASPGAIAVAAVSSALALNWFFIKPYGTFSIGSAEDLILFGSYLTVAFATGGLVSRLRSRERLLARRQRSAAFLLRAARRLAPCTSAEEAIAEAEALASGFFGLPVSFSVGAPGEESAGVARILPVIGAQAGDPGIVARAAIPPRTLWTRSDDELLGSLGQTLALVLARERSEEAERRAELELRSQRLAKLLLDSVSHEMRTPLTTITGSLSALRDEALSDRPEARAALLEGALGAAASLNRVLEDILWAGRIESGLLRLRRESYSLAEILEAAAVEARPALEGRELETRIDGGEARYEVDGPLAIRLAANLLRNAGRHSRPGGPVFAEAGPEAGGFRIVVRDAGPGIREDLVEDLVAGRRPVGARGSPGGLGMGLRICRGIAEAHGGTLSFAMEGGGFAVAVVFPDCRSLSRQGEETP